ncbi:MAG: hypothetical protein IKA22_05675 [Lentisphaeria bacterium]|nr:hypothetical protein [Lentisphaeria bacterium]
MKKILFLLFSVIAWNLSAQEILFEADFSKNDPASMKNFVTVHNAPIAQRPKYISLKDGYLQTTYPICSPLGVFKKPYKITDETKSIKVEVKFAGSNYLVLCSLTSRNQPELANGEAFQKTLDSGLQVIVSQEKSQTLNSIMPRWNGESVTQHAPFAPFNSYNASRNDITLTYIYDNQAKNVTVFLGDKKEPIMAMNEVDLTGIILRGVFLRSHHNKFASLKVTVD